MISGAIVISQNIDIKDSIMDSIYRNSYAKTIVNKTPHSAKSTLHTYIHTYTHTMLLINKLQQRCIFTQDYTQKCSKFIIHKLT